MKINVQLINTLFPLYWQCSFSPQRQRSLKGLAAKMWGTWTSQLAPPPRSSSTTWSWSCRSPASAPEGPPHTSRLRVRMHPEWTRQVKVMMSLQNLCSPAGGGGSWSNSRSDGWIKGELLHFGTFVSYRRSIMVSDWLAHEVVFHMFCSETLASEVPIRWIIFSVLKS